MSRFRTSPLGLVLVIGALMLLWSAGPAPAARAAVASGSIAPDPVVNPDNGVATIVAQETNDQGPISVRVTSGTLTLDTCHTGVSTNCSVVNVSNDGTSTVTVTTARDSDGTPDETLTLTFVYDPPTVTSSHDVTLSGCQGAGCTRVTLDTVEVLPATDSPADDIDLTVEPGSIGCGTVFRVTAEVTADGAHVADGTDVTFTTSTGQQAVVETSGGFASVDFAVPQTFSGPITVVVESGVASAQVTVSVQCAAGPPAQIALTVTPTSTNCGAQVSVLARVLDAGGRLVSDNVVVSFTTTFGTIVPTAPTIAGVATSVLTSIPGTPGTAQVTAGVGGVSAGPVTVVFSCVVAPAPTPPPAAPPPAPAPTTPSIRPPSTGDAGLR